MRKPHWLPLITKKGVDLLKNEFCSTATSPGVLQGALQHRLVVISIWCAPASYNTTALEFDTGPIAVCFLSIACMPFGCGDPVCLDRTQFAIKH